MAAPEIVLICEDEPYLRELMRISLDAGYDVREAASVAEAADALRSSRPDLVLVDLMLPGGSGLDILRDVRETAGDDVPVVVVSAWSTGEHRDAAEEAGATAFVPKPFVPEELAALVRQLLDRTDE